jgi:hypothetical protein
MPFKPLKFAKRVRNALLDALPVIDFPADLGILPEPKNPVTKEELVAQLHCAPEHVEYVAPPWCCDHVAWAKYMKDMEDISYGLTCHYAYLTHVPRLRIEAQKRLPSLTIADLFLVARLTPRDPESPWLVDLLEEEMKRRRIPSKLRAWMRRAAA